MSKSVLNDTHSRGSVAIGAAKAAMAAPVFAESTTLNTSWQYALVNASHLSDSWSAPCDPRDNPSCGQSGGLRPIAVGEVLRRLVSKCLVFHSHGTILSLLTPLQLGVGVRGGCEAIVHAVSKLAASDSQCWTLQSRSQLLTIGTAWIHN